MTEASRVQESAVSSCFANSRSSVRAAQDEKIRRPDQ